PPRSRVRGGQGGGGPGRAGPVGWARPARWAGPARSAEPPTWGWTRWSLDLHVQEGRRCLGPLQRLDVRVADGNHVAAAITVQADEPGRFRLLPEHSRR